MTIQGLNVDEIATADNVQSKEHRNECPSIHAPYRKSCIFKRTLKQQFKLCFLLVGEHQFFGRGLRSTGRRYSTQGKLIFIYFYKQKQLLAPTNYKMRLAELPNLICHFINCWHLKKTIILPKRRFT